MICLVSKEARFEKGTRAERSTSAADGMRLGSRGIVKIEVNMALRDVLYAGDSARRAENGSVARVIRSVSVGDDRALEGYGKLSMKVKREEWR